MSSERQSAVPEAAIAERLEEAMAHHRAGRLHQALRAYRGILEVKSDHPDALNLAGLASYQMGDLDKAVPLLRSALAVRPGFAAAHNNLGVVLLAQGAPEEAADACRTAIDLNPNYADAHVNLGNALAALDRFDEARDAYERAIALRPEHILAHENLAATLHKQGRLADAEASYRNALAINPDLPPSHNGLGVVLMDQGRTEEALAAYKRAIELQPRLAEAHNNMGNALYKEGRYEEAEAACRRALKLRPDFVEATVNLGNALQKLQRYEDAERTYREALITHPEMPALHNNLGNALAGVHRHAAAAESFRRALALKPDYAEAHANLGSSLRQLGELDDALVMCRRSLELRPESAEAITTLGNVLQEMGRLGEALDAYDRALAIRSDLPETWSSRGNALLQAGRVTEAIDSQRQAVGLRPDFVEGHIGLGNALQDCGELDEAISAFRKALELDPQNAAAHSSLIFCICYNPRFTAADDLAEARNWDAVHGARVAPLRRLLRNRPDPERRLRVGYVSGDFCRHPVGYLIASVIAGHDRDAFDVYCYSGRAVEDDLTSRIRESATVWRRTPGMPNDDLARLVRDDEIDLLVDLSGHTGRNRLVAFAMKPAPVQMSWLGSCQPTGLAAMDYVLMDEHIMPPGTEHAFNETVFRLPECRWCYTPPEYAPAVAPLPASEHGHVRFGCFNNPSKLSPEVTALWCDILRAVPDSRLVLKWKSFGEEAMRERFRRMVADNGIDPARLEMRGQSSHADMLGEYGDIDIALDPFPFGGGITSCEALWMGVPVVTWPGERPVSRQTLPLLAAAGHRELAANDRDDYVTIAAGLAGDLGRLASIRSELRPRLAASTMCDGERFARNLEAAYREMWRRWCETRGPNEARQG